MKAFGLTGWAMALALLASSASFAQPAKSSATGSGMLKYSNSVGDPQERSFAFHAVTHQDNSTTGEAEMHNRLIGFSAHIDVNCLYVENNGKVARLTGKVQRSTDPAYVGASVWFKVIDNGEGAKAPPDRISMVWFWLGDGPVCSDTSVDAPTLPITGGDVQVH